MLPAVELGGDTRALITGASRGIGRAIALELAGRGCAVSLIGRRTRELEQVAESVTELGGTPLVVTANVAELRQVQAAVDRHLEQFGGLDLLVANAGVAWYGPFRDMPLEEGERMTRVNWLGTMYTVGAALPHMLDRGRGHIVVMSSAAAHRSFPWAAAYGATKFAQRGFLEALRHELSGTGVDVTGVYPGQVRTHLHDDDRAHGRMPDWHRPRMAIEPGRVARETLRGVERRRPSVYVPGFVRVLGLLHGLSPALADRVLRLAINRTAAPWSR
jgi:short-subunit dehydrogenase